MPGNPSHPRSGTANLLALLRDTGPLPMAELGDHLRISRSQVSQRVVSLEEQGLLTRGGRAPSRGGRPSSIVGLSDSLYYLGVDIGATSVAVAITNGYLDVVDFVEEDADIREGPEPILGRAIQLARKLVASQPGIRPLGLGIGVPGPVSFRDGHPVAPPLMPGWDGYQVRDVLFQRLGIPVTVDNDVNIMALGEMQKGVARAASSFLFVKAGTGIGCGIVVGGAIHRGAQGCAGDIGHIRVGNSTTLCHCGRTGCLEADFGGEALARKALTAARNGESPLLAQWLDEKGTLTAADVGRASAAGDRASNSLIRNGGQLIGQVIRRPRQLLQPLDGDCRRRPVQSRALAACRDSQRHDQPVHPACHQRTLDRGERTGASGRRGGRLADGQRTAPRTGEPAG